MEPVLQGYPVSFIVVGISILVLAFLGLMTFFHLRAPNVITPVLVVSLFMMLTFVVAVIYSTLQPLPESKTGDLLLGALISTFTTMIAYWFGKKHE